ncbi:hypothetical protein EAG_05742 [Camponotus floridanus]|uniref:Uncharacterized protein n=1 Tax=Camponotus floridanus TaxID=104421 RepID=E2A3V4_CAMFO|nr:hypothetical protein EAG_05742 [Camponotus floridanus]
MSRRRGYGCPPGAAMVPSGTALALEPGAVRAAVVTEAVKTAGAVKTDSCSRRRENGCSDARMRAGQSGRRLGPTEYGSPVPWTGSSVVRWKATGSRKHPTGHGGDRALDQQQGEELGRLRLPRVRPVALSVPRVGTGIGTGLPERPPYIARLATPT